MKLQHRLAVSAPDLVHTVPCLNPARDGIQLLTVICFIVQSLSLAPLNCLDELNYDETGVKYQGPVVQN